MAINLISENVCQIITSVLGYVIEGVAVIATVVICCAFAAPVLTLIIGIWGIVLIMLK
jgi:type IV secretory pathway VirB2 component (pilin)